MNFNKASTFFYNLEKIRGSPFQKIAIPSEKPRIHTFIYIQKVKTKKVIFFAAYKHYVILRTGIKI